jgi:hypothetical protein
MVVGRKTRYKPLKSFISRKKNQAESSPFSSDLARISGAKAAPVGKEPSFFASKRQHLSVGA